MKSSKSLAEQRCYTFVNWARKEKPQTKMKVQGHSSTARAKKAHRVLTHRTNKLTASTHMDADQRKIGRKKFKPPQQESDNRAYDPRRDHHQTKGGYSNQGRGRG
jgi:hypothetical protein